MTKTHTADRFPVFGPECADCASCELKGSLAKGFVGLEVTAKYRQGGLMIVGEGPGAQELIQRRPLIGKPGALLDALLREAGIDREDCVVTLATMCVPPRVKDTGSLQERFPKAVPACQPRLDQEIKHYKPRVIVALGGAALDALIGYSYEKKSRQPFACSLCGPSNPQTKRSKSCPECGGYKTREHVETLFKSDHKATSIMGTVLPGSMVGLDGVPYIIPTMHPSLILRGADAGKGAALGGQFIAPAVIEHLRKAKHLLRHDANYDVQLQITSDPAEVRRYLYPSEGRTFAVDIETASATVTELDAITCVGICAEGTTTSLVVDTRDASPELLAIMRYFLEDPDAKKVLHNRLFDEAVFDRVWGIQVQGTVADTMMRQRALFPDEPAKLQWLAARYTYAPPWKTTHHPTFEDLAIYNARDTRATIEIHRTQQREIAPVETVVEVDTACANIALQMMSDGVRVNFDRMHEIEAVQVARRDTALAAMLEITADRADWSPHKSKDLIWALFDGTGPCRLVPPTRTETGAPSTAKDALSRLRGAHPFVEHLANFRKADKLISTYCQGEGLKIDPRTGRLHPTWNPGGARTGRWTSENPNFQNWPEIMRGIIEAGDGRTIVGADESQLELRVMAALCGDEELIRRCLEADEGDKLNPDRDPHSYVASVSFGDAFMQGDKTRRKALRDLAKTVIYAINYGAGAAKILDSIQSNAKYDGPPVRLDIVQRIIATIFKVFPRVGTWREQQLVVAEREGEVRSALHGRRRIYPLGEVDATIAWNFPIQSTAADLVNDSLIAFYRDLPAVDPSAFVIAQVHDAIYVECDEHRAQDVARLLEKRMTHSISLVDGAPAMRFEATAKIDKNWGKL